MGVQEFSEAKEHPDQMEGTLHRKCEKQHRLRRALMPLGNAH